MKTEGKKPEGNKKYVYEFIENTNQIKENLSILVAEIN